MPINLNELSTEELKKIKKDKQKNSRKSTHNTNNIKKNKRLIANITKIQKRRKNIKSQYKTPKPTPPKSFAECFQECIRNKTIPPDTPSYLRKALERALREYQQGNIKNKSVLGEFAEKYIIKGEFGFKPIEYFKNKDSQLKDFFRRHRNVKVRFVLVCLMEQVKCADLRGVYEKTDYQEKAYFQSETHINLESTDVKKNTCKNDSRNIRKD